MKNVYEVLEKCIEDLKSLSAQVIQIARTVNEVLTEHDEYKKSFKIVYGGKFNAKNENKEESALFQDKEIEKMPKHIKLLFKAGKIKATCRNRKGIYEIRCQFNKNKITASSKTLETAKQKFLQKLNSLIPSPEDKNGATVFFSDYARSWLEIKKRTVKRSTYDDYVRTVEIDLIPKFKNKRLNEIARQSIQDVLFDVVDSGLNRKAKKLYMVLRSIFEYAEEDFALSSPLKKIVLPRYVEKKGAPLSISEEEILVNHCVKNCDHAGTSALLVLLYFGLRRSELSTLRVGSNEITVTTSKTRFGTEEVTRTIPFTPAFKRVLQYVDFEKAKKTNFETLRSAFKRLFPERHPHELRYTFITRCKESGVNLEVVMLWAGHESDVDVKSSRVNRGYTRYSSEYLHAEAQKVNYVIDLLKK